MIQRIYLNTTKPFEFYFSYNCAATFADSPWLSPFLGSTAAYLDGTDIDFSISLGILHTIACIPRGVFDFEPYPREKEITVEIFKFVQQISSFIINFQNSIIFIFKTTS
jgi:hypothetical protein